MSMVLVEPSRAYEREGPVVTVLGRDKNIDISAAEPSPVMVHGRRVWSGLKTFIKLSIVAGLIGGYPLAMWLAHDINDTPAFEVRAEDWASPATGAAITLIAREVEGPGWTGDKPAWTPARQLTAQPAWQEAMMHALADHLQIAAAGVTRTDEIDPDLAAASRLLRPVSEGEMTPRLVAAAEALARYNGRVHAGLVGDHSTDQDLAQSLQLFAGWAAASRADVSDLIGHGEGWPASRADVRAYYLARARGQVAASLLLAAAESRPDLMRRASLRAQFRETGTLWTRVAEQAPLVVSNQSGDGLLLPNHLAAMAWHLDEAEAATVKLAELVLGAQPDTTLAESDLVVLTSSP